MSENNIYIIKAPNGARLARTKCKDLNAVWNAAVDGKIDDQTRQCKLGLTNPRFVIDRDCERRFIVSLVARNGKTVAELMATYMQKASALHGIKCLKRVAMAALRQQEATCLER